MTPQPWYFSVFGVFFQARARIFGEGAKAPEAEAWLTAAFGTKSNCCGRSNLSNCLLIQWIGLREKNRKTPIFHEKIFGFRLSFSLKPIH